MIRKVPLIVSASFLLILLGLLVLHAARFGINCEFYPLNGSFQTYNPLRKILSGLFPGRDFYPYLGFGATYFQLPWFALFGGDFAASRFVIHLMLPLCHLVSIFILSHLVILNVHRALFFALAFSIVCAARFLVPTFQIPWIDEIFLFFDNRYFTGLNSFIDLLKPGNSNRGLRSFAPYLMVMGLWMFFRAAPENRSERLRPSFFVAMGFLGGTLFFWSNDFGVGTFFSAFLVGTLAALKQNQGRLKSFAFLSGSLAASFSFCVALLSFGQPLKLLSEMQEVSNFQYWYFQSAKSVTSPSDLISWGRIVFYFVPALFIVFDFTFKVFDLRRFLLALLTVACIFGCLIPVVGGRNSDEYFYALEFLSIFLFLRLALRLSSKILKKWQVQSNFSTLGFASWLLMPIIFFVAFRDGFNRIEPLLLTPLQHENLVPVEELGCGLPKSWSHEIKLGRFLSEQVRGRKPHERIMSTYSSMMDVMASSFNQGQDYIIHNLSESSRRLYVDSLLRNQPLFVTTLRQDFTLWENWNRQVNWYFYREVFRRYTPVRGSEYNLIWKKNETPTLNESVWKNCQLFQGNKWSQIIGLPSSEGEDSEPTIYEFKVSYRSSGNQRHFGQRPLVRIYAGDIGGLDETQASLLEFLMHKQSRKTFGVPSSATEFIFPMVFEQESSRRASLFSTGFGSELDLTACSFRKFKPYKDTILTASLPVTSTQKIDRHILINIQPDALVDPLQKGMVVLVGGKAIGTIKEIRESQVLVEVFEQKVLPENPQTVTFWYQ